MCDAIYSVLVYENEPYFRGDTTFEEIVEGLKPSLKVSGAQVIYQSEFNSDLRVWHMYSNGYPEEVTEFVSASSNGGYEVIDLTTGERETVFGGCYMKRTFRTEMKKRLHIRFGEFVDALSQVTHK